MKLQTWCKIKGIAIKIANTRVSLKGVRKGDATSVAIMVAPSGKNARRGSEIYAYKSLAK
jgi:hypothetical protein